MTPRESGQTSIWSFFTRELGEPMEKAKQMTAEMSTTAGAAFHVKVDWHAIDWHQAHQNVNRLQARIVKATQEGRWGKVKALQRLLTHSFSAKVLAIKRVTENQGKRTPGVDGDIWNTPAKKAAAIQKLRQRGYRPQPLRRIYIPKSDGKRQRPLGIPVMLDRAMQALYLLALDPIAETTADPNSYGFRKERSPADAIEQCHIVLSNRGGAEWIWEGDIRACFDRISHEWLLDHIPMDKAILRKWLKAGFMEQYVLYPTETGTPQGAVCSPVLANLTLDGLEKKLRERYPKATSQSRRAKVNLVRFADDFIITGSTQELLEQEVEPPVEQFLKERGLELSLEKTHITHIADGFDFLGQHIREYKGKILIQPSRKNVSTFLGKVRRLIKANAQATAGNLILQLNPVIRGWANYHRHVSSKRTFAKVDHAIFQALWQWAKRRHPKKSKRWIKDKYFHTVGGRNWVFRGQATGKAGRPQTVQLFDASSLPIQRHVKIKGEANPYDPHWEVYFEERLGVKMTHNLQGRRMLRYLWKEQNGICPVCGEKITQLTGWHNHHIVWRTKGGGDSAENRVLLHPNCHSQVHSRGLEVTKPRPARGV
jgi:RNA-directed DNA polymerase